MADTMTLDQVFYTNRNIIKGYNQYYSSPLSNTHQYISGYLYNIPTTVASAYFTGASQTIISRFYLTSPTVKLTIACRELATGDLKEGTFETSLGTSMGTLPTITGDLSVGFNYFSGLYTQTSMANVRVIITLQQEF